MRDEQTNLHTTTVGIHFQVSSSHHYVQGKLKVSNGEARQAVDHTRHFNLPRQFVNVTWILHGPQKEHEKVIKLPELAKNDAAPCLQ